MSDVKYDKILGAFRENDGNVSGVVAGSDFVSAVNAKKPFPTNWDPAIIETNTLSDILLKIMWRFDEDEQKNAIAHAEINEKISGGGGVDTSILMGAPDYSAAQISFSRNTTYSASCNGWVFATFVSDSDDWDSEAAVYAYVDDIEVAHYNHVPCGMYFTLSFPVKKDSLWIIEADPTSVHVLCSDIIFVPCTSQN